MLDLSNAPLPVVNGVNPSFINLPPGGQWPTVLAFLVERFPMVGEAELRRRLQAGELVDDSGVAFNVTTPYRPKARLWYYRQVPTERVIPFEETILYQDRYLVVADKPHFLTCVPAGNHLYETLLSRLRYKLAMPQLTPIHRLDRETAGIMLFCADPASRGAYQQLFATREVQKEYEAIAPYRADLALPLRLANRLEEDPANRFQMITVAGEVNAITDISLIERRGNWARYRLQPATGKKHQLRAHLGSLGIGIANDPWYPVLTSITKDDDFSRPLQLLARAISFTDPVSGEPRYFRSPRTLSWPPAEQALQPV
ncbi:pseudouridine synthase [Chitinolyticbacter meiyuanensis]|uniref:pseudouridine synthase n=1 Tax=Chitinolyticbacter meiyuanensis TaxID=682798 RepID=UPI0011E5C69C|nr:pseudouridine synthase [Chitinolyticbacter meiyuanensis]